MAETCRCFVTTLSKKPCFYNVFTIVAAQHGTCSVYACFADIDECASYPCNNAGTCVDNIDSYTCHCVAGYEGYSCDEGNAHLCMKTGTCV